MKKTLTILLLNVLLFSQLVAQVTYTINEKWKFKKTNELNTQTFTQPDQSWESVSIPHTWNDKDALDDTSGFYQGMGCYFKSQYIGTEAKDKVVYLYFEGANQTLELFVNGQRVGKHIGGYSSFCFDISAFVKCGEMNTIIAKVDNSIDKDIAPLSADFTFFGGIYRDVYLSINEKVHISLADNASSGVYITPFDVSEKEAKVCVTTKLTNKTATPQKVTVEYTLLSPEGKELGTSKQALKLKANADFTHELKSIKVINPMLWSPDSPTLYTLRTKITDTKGLNTLSENYSSFGIRYFNFSSEKGFSLNGKPMKLMGVNRHQSYKDLGWALPDEIHIRDIQMIKEMGGNFLRIAHYPQDPTILQMCDKLGILATVEIPIVNTVTESAAFLENSLKMAREMVRQNFNHPSLIMWAYMNEVMLNPPYAKNPEKHKKYCLEVNRQAKAIDSLLRHEDPTRYTMLPCHGSLSAYEVAGLMEIPQIIGWNLYQGWYKEEFPDFDKYMDNFHAKYPNIPTFIAEYGADVDPRLHSFSPKRFDYTAEYANLYHEHYLKAIMDRDYIFGGTIWNFNDFYSEKRGDAVPHTNNKGIVGLDRQPKDTYLYYKAHFGKKPVVLIGAKNWTVRGGMTDDNKVCKQPLNIFSNLDSVKVTLNGSMLGKYPVKDCIARLNVPFINGENIIIASGNSKSEVIEDAIHVQFKMVANQIQNTELPFTELNVMLGSTRYFEDKIGNIIWIPEKEYQQGSWGYIGGAPLSLKVKSGALPAMSKNILGTEQDPIFQTQRVGIKSFKLDVPNGKYFVSLYLAELTIDAKTEELIYNLGNTVEQDKVERRVFNVTINNAPQLQNFDMARQIGSTKAIIKKFTVDVFNGKGISVDFEPVIGEPVLNAIRIVKID
jgi:beta-galactosidase